MRPLAIVLFLMVWISSPGVARAQCGSIPWEGCCADDGHSKYCSGGKIQNKDCTALAGTDKGTTSCGWDGAKYTCTTNTSSDPSGKFVRLCSALPDAGPGVDKTVAPKEAGVNCGAITSKGCCEGADVTKYCSGGSLKSKTCTGATPKCGWSTASNFYTCTAAEDADPSGANPRLCADVKPGDGGGTKKEGGSTTVDKSSTNPEKAVGTPDVSVARQDKGKTTKSDSGGCSYAVSVAARPLSLMLLLAAGLLGLVLRRRR